VLEATPGSATYGATADRGYHHRSKRAAPHRVIIANSGKTIPIITFDSGSTMEVNSTATKPQPAVGHDANVPSFLLELCQPRPRARTWAVR